MTYARDGAGIKQWADGLPNQARRGDLQLDEPQTLFNICEPWRLVAVRWTGSSPNLDLGNVFSALRLYTNETNGEAPCTFRWTAISVRRSFLNNPLLGLCF